MEKWHRWQDWASVVLGVLLFLAPFAFGATDTPPAAWTGYVGGALLVIVGLVDLSSPSNHVGEWLAGILGVLIFISPWVLGFSAMTQMAWSAWVVGALSVLLAAWVLFAGSAKQQTLAAQH
jgi:SPW repeat